MTVARADLDMAGVAVIDLELGHIPLELALLLTTPTGSGFRKVNQAVACNVISCGHL